MAGVGAERIKNLVAQGVSRVCGEGGVGARAEARHDPILGHRALTGQRPFSDYLRMPRVSRAKRPHFECKGLVIATVQPSWVDIG